MCGGGGGGGSADQYADHQRAEQQKRERRVREGVDQLDALFEGGQHGIDPASSFDPDKKYYDASGNILFRPGLPEYTSPASTPADPYVNRGTNSLSNMDNQRAGGDRRPGGGRSYGVPEPPREPNQAYSVDHDFMQQVVEDGLAFTDVGTAQGFDDNFYNQRRDAYLEYANPEVDRQYGDALEDLTFALSRAGTLNSSVAADRYADTEQQRNDARMRIADAADDQSSQARQAVSDERSRLTQLIHATGDPTASLAGVGDILTSLRTNPVYDPIGPVFQNASAGVGNYLQGQRYADMQRRLDGLFRTPSDSSGRMVN